MCMPSERHAADQRQCLLECANLMMLCKQVFKFCCYISIPIGMTVAISGSPKNLENLIKNVSCVNEKLFMLLQTHCDAVCRADALRCCLPRTPHV